MEKIIFKNLFMLGLRDLIKLSGKRGGQEHNIFIPLCNYMSKSALCFLARCIFVSSTCVIHLHPLLKLGIFLHLEGEWMGLGKIGKCVFSAFAMEAFKSLKMKTFSTMYFSVWEPACMWVFVLQLFGGSAPTRIRLFCRRCTELLEKLIGEL